MKEVGGAKLVAMSREELAAFFEPSVGNILAPKVANSFRDAVLSNRKGALSAWAKRTLSPQEAANVEKRAQDIVEQPLHENMEHDVMESALGIDLTAEEVEKINELVAKLQIAAAKEPNNIYLGYHTDYFEAKDELNKFLDTANPMSTLEVTSRVVFRGNMLFSAKSILTNIIGNAINAVSEKVGNVIYERKWTGVNSDLIKDYIKTAGEVYYKTGLDVVRAMEISGGHTVLGEHYKGVGQGKGALRSYARFVEQYVMKMGQGLPDIVFAATHFADNINVLTTKLADAKGLSGEAHKAEARRLFLLATSLTLDETNPDHLEALQIRRTAVQYAMVATYQNDTSWTKAALKAREVIDDYTGDLYLGTNLVPFVKTLINIADLSLQRTGVTSAFIAARAYKAYKAGDVAVFQESVNMAIRAGLGVLTAAILAASLGDDDYLPDYILASSYQKELQKLSNAGYNSIRVGDSWVSLGYFGTFGYVLAGFLGARNANTKADQAWEYMKNTGLQVRQAPIIEQIADFYTYLAQTQEYHKDGAEVGSDAIAYVANFFMARSIPMIVGDIAIGMDEYQRYTGYGLESVSAQFQAKIPFWRELLPPKYNGFGDMVRTEGLVKSVLFGAKVKNAPTDDAVYKELSNLARWGNQVKLDVDSYKSSKQLRKILSAAEYNEYRGVFSKALSTSIANAMTTEDYKNAEDDEARKAILMGLREEALSYTIEKLGYESRLDALED